MWELYVTQLSQEQITLVIPGGNAELAGSFVTALPRFAPSFPISGCFALCCVSTMSDAVWTSGAALVILPSSRYTRDADISVYRVYILFASFIIVVVLCEVIRFLHFVPHCDFTD